MFELKQPAQWRAPWRLPEASTLLPKVTLVDSLKNMLGRTIKGVQNFLIKNMLE